MSSNFDRVQAVKYHVHFLLSGLPQLSDPISYAEMATALRQLANEYDAIAAGENETALPFD